MIHIKKDIDTKLRRLVVQNWIVNNSDSKPSRFDRRLWYDSDFSRLKIVFDWCKQSLTRSILPSSQCHIFCTKKERLAIYCINLLLISANYKTGMDRFFIVVVSKKQSLTQLFCLFKTHSEFSTQNFQFKCSTFSISHLI